MASMPKTQFSKPTVPINSSPTVFSGNARSAQPHTEDSTLNITICQKSIRPGCHKRLNFIV